MSYPPYNVALLLKKTRRQRLARDPSSLGHEGAGKMLDDVWVFDIRSRRWTEVQARPGEAPTARGWYDADVVRGSTKEAIVVHGGLNESNERLGDVWSLEI
ncbi:MAG: hypothetical protein Q9196_004769 [Gyalolechia fulgens]